jgi:hypothetical protein
MSTVFGILFEKATKINGGWNKPKRGIGIVDNVCLGERKANKIKV